MNSRAFWMSLLIGSIATPVCWLLGALLSGGHTVYPMSMILLFPYALLFMQIFQSTIAWWLIGLPAFALQFPLYGAAVGLSRVKGCSSWMTIGLAGVHFLMILMTIEYMGHNQ